MASGLVMNAMRCICDSQLGCNRVKVPLARPSRAQLIENLRAGKFAGKIYVPAYGALFTGGRIALRLKKSWSDGTTHVVFTPEELVEKLAALVPPPRVNQLRYHGVFAPRHKLRRVVVPQAQASNDDNGPSADAPCTHRIGWAKLMQRVFEIDVLKCPNCESQMQRIAFITRPDTIRAILKAVGFAADSPIAA